MSSRRLGRGLIVLAILAASPEVVPAQEAANSRASAIRGAIAAVEASVVSVRSTRHGFREPLSSSGVVVEAARGLVATTGEAIFGDQRIEVVLPNGSIQPARRIFLADPATKLVILQIDPAAPGLAVADLGGPTALQLGDEILALGRSATGRLLASAGIVASVRSRDEADFEVAPFAIDALVTVETAGGPLVDHDGRVVGISLPGEGPTADVRHLGTFPTAITSDHIRAAIAAFGDGGGRLRSYLGVQLAPARRLPGDFPPTLEGAVVTGVAMDSPAAVARLEAGDRITAIDGRKVRDALTLQRAISVMPVDRELTLTVIRGDETLEVKVRTASRPGESLPSPVPPEPPTPDRTIDSPVQEPSPSETPKNDPKEGSHLPKSYL